MSPLHDSGDRREFDTGAVRDMQEGKGRCDLLPACALLRLARHYEAGANKYEPRNWEKGIPISVMIDSGLRHILKYLDGWTDEDHLAAAAWNILGAMWMEEKRPDLQDITTRPVYDLNVPPNMIIDDEARHALTRELNDVLVEEVAHHYTKSLWNEETIDKIYNILNERTKENESK